jgi:hypothetical protein
MKKIVFLLGVLLSLGMFCACSSDDEDERVKNESSEEVIINPVVVVDGYEDISSFFNSELHLTTDTYGFFVGFNFDESVCQIIHSRKELQDIYSGDKELPDINFQQNSLIVGKEVFPHLLYKLEKKELVFEKRRLLLNLYVSEPKDRYYPAALLRVYYWGLYPKVEANEVSVNVIEVEE